MVTIFIVTILWCTAWNAITSKQHPGLDLFVSRAITALFKSLSVSARACRNCEEKSVWMENGWGVSCCTVHVCVCANVWIRNVDGWSFDSCPVIQKNKNRNWRWLGFHRGLCQNMHLNESFVENTMTHTHHSHESDLLQLGWNLSLRALEWLRVESQCLKSKALGSEVRFFYFRSQQCGKRHVVFSTFLALQASAA